MPKVKIDDTLEMYYEDDNFTDPWKTTETAILQHCNGGSGKLYYRWPAVAARYYRFIRVDRRGQGGSTVPPPGHPWSLAGLSQEMDVFLDRLGLEKVHLIGEATGSCVSAQYAYEHPERLSSLTLINCAPVIRDLPTMLDGARLVEEEGVESYVRKSMLSRFDPDVTDPDYIEWHAQEKLKQPAHVSAEVKLWMGSVELTDILPNIKVPTLVIAAEKGGRVHTMESARQVQELVPNAKLVAIPGISGYVAHVAPEQCAEAWMEFVRGLG